MPVAGLHEDAINDPGLYTQEGWPSGEPAFLELLEVPRNGVLFRRKEVDRQPERKVKRAGGS